MCSAQKQAIEYVHYDSNYEKNTEQNNAACHWL